MTRCTIALKSLTHAMKAQDVLSGNAIWSRVIKSNGPSSGKGCAYGLEVDCAHMKNAAALLARYTIPYSDAGQFNT